MLELFQDGSLQTRMAFLDMTLLARQLDGIKFCVASQQRVWIITDGRRCFDDLKLDKLPISAHFDLSSYFTLLSAPFVQLSLVLQVSCLDDHRHWPTK